MRIAWKSGKTSTLAEKDPETGFFLLLIFGFLPPLLSLGATGLAWLIKAIGLITWADGFLLFYSWAVLVLFIPWLLLGLCLWFGTGQYKKLTSWLLGMVGLFMVFSTTWGQQHFYRTMFGEPIGRLESGINSSSDNSLQQAAKETQEKIHRFEQRRKSVESLLNNANTDRDELLGKLREAGVFNSSDLKGNTQGQKLAKLLQQLSAEIDGLEKQIEAIDNAILEAKSVVRKLEREQTGISDDEMRKLAEQLREAEERTDGAAKLVTPLEVEAALDKALKKETKPPKKGSIRESRPKLPGFSPAYKSLLSGNFLTY